MHNIKECLLSEIRDNLFCEVLVLVGLGSHFICEYKIKMDLCLSGFASGVGLVVMCWVGLCD